MPRAPRATVAALLPALVAALGLAASPQLALAAVPTQVSGVVRADPSPTYGAIRVVAGGGHGWSGPASRADVARGSSIDAAPDGTVLIASRATGEVLRVDPTSDRLAVIADADPLGAPLDLVDVAAAGVSAVVATGTGILQVAADGARTELAAISGITALDVGSDGVVWVATAGQVLRVLPDGTVVPATPADQFGALTELTVTPDGTRAFVLEGAADKWAVYPVTAAGAGARVAGTLARSDSLLTGMPATSASTEAVESITTDGTSIWMSSSEYRRVVRFPVGGTITQVIDGVDPESVAVLDADLAVALTDTSAWTWRLERFTVAGAGRGRLVGLDPARPWSPDGVRADDAHLGTVRGAAALADGRTVFTTSAGLVREVGLDGLLSTRATLAPIATRGKVAVATDGTAYVVTDAGTLAAVPAVGPATTLALDADITDVEVRPDGTVVVADRRGDRLLTVPPGGSTAVLATGLVDPSDLSLDGTDVLVADSGIRRVTAAGSVSTVLTGGAPGEVARTSEGVWTRPNDRGLGAPGAVPVGGHVAGSCRPGCRHAGAGRFGRRAARRRRDGAARHRPRSASGVRGAGRGRHRWQRARPARLGRRPGAVGGHPGVARQHATCRPLGRRGRRPRPHGALDRRRGRATGRDLDVGDLPAPLGPRRGQHEHHDHRRPDHRDG